jgi:hypothetical protein
MKSESADGSLNSEATADGGQRRPYMITLCRLTKAVSIKPPRSPRLASFTFFTTRVLRPDGSERLYLHMGYFATLSEAQQWAQRVRTRYPNAIATPAPRSHVQVPSSDAAAPEIHTTVTTPALREFPPVRDDHLSDSQVMRALETRAAGTLEHGTDESAEVPVELLRPDDTQTKRALKVAVVEGAPVPFAVQLEWSQQPIDADRVPRLDIFKGYTLYRTETRRGVRRCYFLRLGFFVDAVSARQFACRVRSIFASAAVVPVSEQELLHADEARIDTAAPAGPYHEDGQEGPNSRAAAVESFSAMGQSSITGDPNTAPKKSSRRARETLEEALKALAEREKWREPDPLDDTGVRHKKVTLEERPVRSIQKQKPPIRLA